MIHKEIIKIPGIIFENMKNRHNKMSKKEFVYIANQIYNITGLDYDDIHMAIAPYIQTV